MYEVFKWLLFIGVLFGALMGYVFVTASLQWASDNVSCFDEPIYDCHGRFLYHVVVISTNGQNIQEKQLL